MGARLCANEPFPSTGDFGHLANVVFGDRGTAGVLQIQIGQTFGNKKSNSVSEGIIRRKIGCSVRNFCKWRCPLGDLVTGLPELVSLGGPQT